MVKALSWSELHTWEHSPQEHYDRYILGNFTPPSSAQEFGSIIHKTIESPQFPWLKELVTKGRPAQEQKTARKILNAVETKRPKESEVYMTAMLYNDIPLAAIFDGLDKGNRELDEYKTSSGSYWTQKTVDSHGQLSFYALVFFINYHAYFREIRLHRLHSKTGTVKTFYTARGPQDLQEIRQRIVMCKNTLEKQGLWLKRLSKKDREKNNMPPLPLVYNLT